MEKGIAVINSGSASQKYAFFVGDTCRLAMHFERTEKGYDCTLNSDEPVHIEEEDFKNSREHFFDAVRSEGYQLSAVGVRVVAPGSFLTEHRIVDQEYLRALDKAAPYDPVHTLPVRTLITDVLARAEAQGIPVVAVSDSAFHKTMLPQARAVALPKEFTNSRDIQRFGYHGIALGALTREIEAYEKVVVCHLGSGASVTALKSGASVDTSMGYSPLEGLIMSSRSGSVDPGIVVNMLSEKTPEEALKILYKESGLKALGGSDDMRVLLQEMGQSETARMAVDVFVHRIVGYVGAYTAILGGIDALVFSGTIGQRSYPIRNMVCEKLFGLRIRVDDGKNKNAKAGDRIDMDGGVPVLVLHADETAEIARVTMRMTNRVAQK